MRDKQNNTPGDCSEIAGACGRKGCKKSLTYKDKHKSKK
jgi:hypothetical protein